jgi:DUF4097 and DUF4098 domain-containing protein YvlB
MTARTLSAATAGSPPRIDVRNPAGAVTLQAVEGSDVVDDRVEALDAAAEQLLDRVEIGVSGAEPERPDSPVTLRVAVPERRLWSTPAFDVRILTPTGAAARVAVASADVHLRGRFGRAELTAASGDLAVDEATECELRTASGNAGAGTVRGTASVGTASGEIRLGTVEGSLRARTASGDVSVERAEGDTSISTASGDVTVGTAAGESVRIKTASGDVTVGVAPGLRVWLDLSSVSGRMQSGLAEDGPAGEGPAQVSLTLRSVSGDLRVRTGSAAPAV